MKIKIGEKVRIIDNKHGHGFNIGEIVEITNKYGINRPYYKAKSVLRNDYLWYIEDDEIEKENNVMKKSDLKIGDMVETRNEDKYIVQNNGFLSSIYDGWMSLEDYDDNMLLSEHVDEYGNDEFDIVKVYRTLDRAYECIWDREKEDMLTKKYLIKQIDTSKDCEGVHWDIKISPNHKDGYGKADGNIQIQLSSVDDYYDDNLFLSVQGAKEMIKALNEIIDYLEN